MKKNMRLLLAAGFLVLCQAYVGQVTAMDRVGKENLEQDKCVICDESMLRMMMKREEKDSTPCILRCGHVFHENCALKWAYNPVAKANNRQAACPTCRGILIPAEATDFIAAIDNNNTRMIESYLKYGVSNPMLAVEEAMKKDLLASAMKNDRRKIEFYLSHDVPANCANEFKKTPLIALLEQPEELDKQLLALFLSHKEDLKWQDNSGNTPLLVTLKQGKMANAAQIAQESPVDSLKIKDLVGKTALQVAKDKKYKEIVKILTARGITQ